MRFATDDSPSALVCGITMNSPKRAQDWFRFWFEASSDAQIILNADGTVQDMNRSAERLLGLPAEAVRGQPYYQILDEETRSRVESLCDRLNPATPEISGSLEVETQPLIQGELADGKPVGISILALPANHEPNSRRFLLTLRNRTPERLLERDKQGLEQKLRSTWDSAPLGFLLVDPLGHITELNKYYLEHFSQPGKHSADWIGSPLSQMEMIRSLGVQLEITRLLQGEEFERSNLKWKNGPGKLRTTLNLVGKPLFGPLGEVSGALVTFLDVTEKTELEEKLQQVQTLKNAVTLAGGLTNDLSNLLNAILGHAGFIKSQVGSNSPYYQDVLAIENATLHAAGYARELMAYAHPSSGEFSPIDLNNVIREITEMVGRSFRRWITFSSELQPKIPPLWGDKTQVARALLNLCLNAHEAMPQGGTIRLRTGFASPNDARVWGLQCTEAGAVWVSVQDSGIGMAPEVKEKIFQPFFSSKIDGTGIGLGLYSVQEIVRRHGGAVHVESQVGRGSTFTLYFPACRDVNRRTEAAEAGLPQGGELVLLVDDEPLIRSMGRGILEAGGFEVITAASGAEAIEIYGKRHQDIRLVLLDLILPDQGGVEVLQQLRAVDPRPRVLLSSGYASEGSIKETTSVSSVGFIQKPYRMQSLLNEVRTALAGRDGGDAAMCVNHKDLQETEVT